MFQLSSLTPFPSTILLLPSHPHSSFLSLPSLERYNFFRFCISPLMPFFAFDISPSPYQPLLILLFISKASFSPNTVRGYRLSPKNNRLFYSVSLTPSAWSFTFPPPNSAHWLDASGSARINLFWWLSHCVPQVVVFPAPREISGYRSLPILTEYLPVLFLSSPAPPFPAEILNDAS